MSTIASRLAEVRRRTGLGVRGFAAALEEAAGYSVSHASVSQYEGGTTPPGPYLAAVCRTFRVRPGWLLCGEGQPDSVEASVIEATFEDIARIMARALPGPYPVETQLEEFFRLSPDPFCILTPDGYCTRLNDAWERSLGHSLSGMVEQPWLDYVHPEDEERTRAALDGTRRSGEGATFENRMRDAAGTYRYFSWRTAYAGGLIFAVGRETTELRRTERRLLRSQASLAAAQRIARLGNWEWDVASNELVWSDQIYRIFGTHPEEFEATYPAFLRIVHPEDRGGVQAAVERALRGEESYNIEHRIVLPSGEVRVVHELGEVTFGADGEPVRMVGTVQDVTQRARAEKELRDRDAILEAVAFAADSLVRTPEWLEAVAAVVGRLGAAADVDGVLLVEHGRGTGRLRLPDGGVAWNAPGRALDASHPTLADLVAVGLERWEDLLSRGHLVQGATTTFPERERAVLASLEIGGLVVVPIFVGPRWWGYICFLSRTERAWSVAETEALRTAAGIIGASIQREEAEAALRRLAEEQAARVEAEAAKERISEVLESITEAFFGLDRDFRVTYVNREGERLLRRSRTQLEGRSLWDELVLGEDSAIHRESQRAMAERRSTVVEEFCPRLDRWFEVHIYPTRSGLSLYFHDVSERKRAAEALHRSQALFSGIVSIAADAIISVDASQRITLFNRGAERIFGYAETEVVGEPLAILLPERFRMAHAERVVGFMGSADGPRYMGERSEIVGRRKNGEEFNAEATISKLRIGDEVILTAVLRDVSEHRNRRTARD